MENETPSLSELVKLLKEHDVALSALKDVPSMLSSLSKSLGEVRDKPKKPTWSLGISEDEDDEKEEQIENADDLLGEGPEGSDIDKYLEDFQKEVEMGAEVTPNIAESFVKTVKRPLTKESKEKLREKVKTPANCKEFLVPKMNTEVWRILPSNGKLADIKNQQLQQVLSLVLSSLARIADIIAKGKQNIPKEMTGSVLQEAINGANLLGDQFQSISSSRKQEIRKYLPSEYSGICSVEVLI
jgi:hypothetical protein